MDRRSFVIALMDRCPKFREVHLDDVADKFDIRRHMRFNTVVEGARWDEETDVWKVTLADGEVRT